MTPEILEWLLHGGNMGFLAFAIWFGVKLTRRLNRDETLRADYPPHRHIGTNGNSKIIYPKEYEPPVIEKLI